MLQAVIDCGGYAPAAERLNKSQSTLSYALQRLQDQLGLTILTVKGRRAVLTEAGEAVLRHARSLINDADNLESLAHSLSLGWEAELMIVIDVICPTPLLLHTLREFEQQHPSIRLELVETALSGTEDAIVRQQADLVLTSFKPTGFLGEKFGSTEMIAVAHKLHPLSLKPLPLDERDLKSYRQIVVRDSGIYRRLDVGWLGSEQRWTVNHFNNSIELLLEGFGFAWVPKDKIAPHLRSGELKPLTLQQGGTREVPLLLVFPKRQRTGPAAKQFAKLLQAQAISCQNLKAQ